MKKYKYIIIFIASLIAILVAFNARAVYNEIQNKASLIKYSPEEGVIDSKIEIIFSDSIPELFYNPDTKLTFGQNCQELGFEHAINGSYFKSDKSHSGLLIIDGDFITDFTRTDNQLTHVVFMDSQTNTIRFISNEDFELMDMSFDGITAFQTGPLIIDKGELQNEYIQNSINGEGVYNRSLLGFTKSGQYFFVATHESMTLEDLASYLLEFEDLNDEFISVINLDGGPSTWLYSKESGIVVEGVTEELPIILGFG